MEIVPRTAVRRMATCALAALAPLAPFVASPPLEAQALQSFTGGTEFSTFETNGDTIGWSFTTTQRFVVTHLGYWDGDFAVDPLALSHPVGLWSASGGAPLASETVLAASPRTGDWRYVTLPSTALLPEGSYHLGAFVPGTNPATDAYVASVSSWTLAPGFIMGSSLRDPSGPQTGLVFPSVTSIAGGRFGPNFRYAAPAPATVLTMTATLDGRSYDCAAETALAAPAGTVVFPCYSIQNTGNVQLGRHNLVDSHLGVLLNDFPFTLVTGAQAYLTREAAVPASAPWTATWTSYNAGPFETTASADALAFTVLPPALTCNGRTLTFSSGFPPGLTSYDDLAWPSGVDDSDADFWDLAACEETQNWTGARGGVACASSDLAGAGAYATQLRTHPFSLVGRSSARIEYTVNYQRDADAFVVEASIDGGETWQPVFTYAVSAGTFRGVGGVRRSHSLAAYLGQAAVRLRWRYENLSVSANDLYVQIDNIALTCNAGIFFDGFESTDTHAWSAASS